jgi:asparagine synthase (glutamine-hydrolysing)
MCGICGQLLWDRAGKIDSTILANMMAAMGHRGPNGEGMYLSGEVGLGHRRLSIIDLETGQQPLSNESGDVWVTYNGEIYNYCELRQILIDKGHTFKTKTDTEVIVHLYEEYGEESVSRLRGMFAFALWDEKKRSLLIVRDRIGIKPLYYVVTQDKFIFASELKSILQDPSVTVEINYPVIDRFLTYYYTPGAETLFRNFNKVEPGHYVVVKDGKIRIEKYWDVFFTGQNGNHNLAESEERLFELVRECARCHLISDVPVGILLSGGIDSTSLLKFSSEVNRDLSTFTIGFEGEDFDDERVYARMAAETFGTKHYEMTIGAEDFTEFLPKYVWHMEELVCEPPAVALYYITKLAKEHVRVLISGEGGDEAFAGYYRYRNLLWLERIKEMIGSLRKPASKVSSMLGSCSSLLYRFKKYAPLITSPLEQYYYSTSSNPFTFFNRNFGDLYAPDFRKEIDKEFSTEPTVKCFQSIGHNDNLSKMLYVDTKTWLPDDLLVKADKITMANSVELRVPLLDHTLIEFAASLPSSFKVNGFTTKYIYKQALKKSLPGQIIKRRKTGFPVPYDRWFARELKEFVNDILFDSKTLSRGYFQQKTISRMLASQNAYSVYSQEIFCLLVLEYWHRLFVDRQVLV